MYALIMVTGLVGLALNFIFVGAEKRVLHWHPSYRPGTEGGQ
jgi:ABC-type nitrate/sulfonate/bicarbonate transport system permease component